MPTQAPSNLQYPRAGKYWHSESDISLGLMHCPVNEGLCSQGLESKWTEWLGIHSFLVFIGFRFVILHSFDTFLESPSYWVMQESGGYSPE